MDSASPADVDSYLLSSKYRRIVVSHLGTEGPATPKEIAADTDARRPHISRALGELRDRDIVELQVSEDRHVGRYYRLTPAGQAAWIRIRDDIRHVPWSVAEPDGDGVEAAVVAAVKAEFGDALRTVLVYEDSAARFIYAAEEVLDQYTDEEIEQSLRSLVFEHTLEEVHMPREEVRSEVLTFTDLSVLRVVGSGNRQFAISFDNDHDVQIPEFTDELDAILAGKGDE